MAKFERHFSLLSAAMEQDRGIHNIQLSRSTVIDSKRGNYWNGSRCTRVMNVIAQLRCQSVYGDTFFDLSPRNPRGPSDVSWLMSVFRSRSVLPNDRIDTTGRCWNSRARNRPVETVKPRDSLRNFADTRFSSLRMTLSKSCNYSVLFYRRVLFFFFFF